LCLFSTVPGAGFAEHLPFVQSIADGLAQALARLDAERRLRELSQQLEHRVDERTHELSEANRKLEAEVAERRKAEEKIRGSQQFLQSSLDALSAHVAILDDEGAIIAVNRAWKRFGADNAGSDGTGGVGANYLNVCERAADARVPEASLMLRGLREVLARQRESFYLEYPCNAPDEERWFQVRASRFEVGGHNRVVVAHENITETKIAERRMREHMEKLGHVHRLETLGEMSAALAHELNQPLAAIANYASGCIRRMENVEGVSPDVMDAMGQVRREAERAAEIIKRMRKFARSQSLQRSPHHVRDIVLETVQLLEPDMRAKGARIRAAAPATTPLVLVDAIHVQQVLINLVRNAVDASAEVPEDERVIAIDVEGPTDGDNFVTVGVTDPGCGIDDDTMDRLFDPFVTTKAHGMGLGLAISRSIIDAHNGRIWARRNDAGAGTSVLFTLPVCQPSQLAAPASGG
jgi:C4-dicarboxylate-specific signal transduction histidine kinase